METTFVLYTNIKFNPLEDGSNYVPLVLNVQQFGLLPTHQLYGFTHFLEQTEKLFVLIIKRLNFVTVIWHVFLETGTKL